MSEIRKLPNGNRGAKRLFSAQLIAIFLLWHPFVQAESALEAKIEELAKRHASVPEMGLSVAIVRGDEIILSRGFGLRDREKLLPVTAKTIFPIGSATKAFTALMAAMLQEQGKIDLQLPIRKYLPEFRLKGTPVGALPLDEAMTPLDLVAHRTGFPRHDALWYLTSFSRAEITRRLQYLDPNPNPTMGFRKAFQYNNVMYLLLGHLLERVSGVSWEALVDEQILRPLEMTQTRFLHDPNSADDFAVPYMRRERVPYNPIRSAAPAGAIESNAEDMARWLQFLVRNGKMSDGKRLLSEKAHTRLFDALIPTDASGSASYGMGWILSRLDGEKLIWHNGMVDGFTAYVSFMPDKKLGVAILCNQNLEGSMHFAIPHGIYRQLLEGKRLPSQEGATTNPVHSDLVPAPVPLVASRRGANLEASISEYSPVGRFVDPGYGLVVIDRTSGGYGIEYYGHRWKLSQTARDTFTFKTVPWAGDTIVKFPDPKKGARVEIGFEPVVSPIRFGRTASQPTARK